MIPAVYLVAKFLYHKGHKDLHKEHYTKSKDISVNSKPTCNCPKGTITCNSKKGNKGYTFSTCCFLLSLHVPLWENNAN
ncbi:hypothetical protein KL86DYS1_11500 [uncultured Dysgonomonas sp.]|uniref:Uncharacterized protein n=1 Tax=uncultured Dysgonomonas sp. TaxID=206096 RepID=A0A212J8S8_9BACT|nr:hypothetical protein KL86DYS1_11500 [uncultured Dysgonomonas sp.]